MTQKTIATILLIAIFFSFSVRPAEAHCSFFHAHHCLKNLLKNIPIVNKVIDVISNAVDTVIQVVTAPVEAIVDLIKDGKTDAFKKTAESFGELGESLYALGVGIVKAVVNTVVIIINGIELIINSTNCFIRVSEIWGSDPQNSCDKADELTDRIGCRASRIDEKISDDCPIDCGTEKFNKWD